MKSSGSIRRFTIAGILMAAAVAFVPQAGQLQAEKTKPSVNGPGSSGLTGNWTSCETVTDSRQDGDNQLTTVTLMQKFEGAVNGTCEGTEKEVVRKDGSRTFSGSGLFTGKINGRSGTVLMTHTGTITGEGVSVADWVLDHGTDELSRIDGHGKSEGKRAEAGGDCSDSATQSAWSGKYTGDVEFGP